MAPTNAVFGNWQVNVIEKVTSGFPLFVVDSGDGSGVYFSYNGGTYQRPNQVGDPNKAGDEGGQTGCPDADSYDSALVQSLRFRSRLLLANWAPRPRAPVYGPRFVNTDFSIIKDFPLPFREGMSLQFRAEFFNLFNHPAILPGRRGRQRRAGYQCTVHFRSDQQTR